MDDKYKLMKVGTASANFEASINSLWQLLTLISLINESTLKKSKRSLKETLPRTKGS